MTEYRILGTADDVTDCQRDGCPKTGLRMTYHLGIIENGEVAGEVYYGSECAAMVTGIPAARIRRKARAADAKKEQERRDREYNARVTLDAYACVADGPTRELIFRFFGRNRYYRPDPGFNIRREVNAMLAEAREALPDYAPDMRPHVVEVYSTGAGWSWSCKCGRHCQGERPIYGPRSDAETAATADHDAMVAAGPHVGREARI